MTNVPWLGKIRRSQVISTYGIGSIVDLEPGSFVPLGLEEWEKQTRMARKSTFTIYESRLQSRLGVEEFHMAPMLEEVNNQPEMVKSEYSVPVVRFPRWLECPKCHRLGTKDKPFEESADGRFVQCSACKNQKVNPVRFVSACPNGHLDDFPWVWWAHRNESNRGCDSPVLYLKSHGESAALADLYVHCVSCNARRGMGDAFKASSLAELSCQGRRNWLLDREDCDQNIRTLQRGASNIHFPAILSALSIPPISEPIFQVLDEHWSVYRSLPLATLPDVLRGAAGELGIPVQSLVNAAKRRLEEESGQTTPPEAENTSLRLDEYTALSSSTDDVEALGGYVSQFNNVVSEPPPEIDKWFEMIGAVSRLREVRALVGFSRIEPQPVNDGNFAELLRNGKLSPLSKSPRKWLPAAELRGEGIFFRFRGDAIDSWIAENPSVVKRARQIDEQSKLLAEDRGYEPPYEITARLLLVHSFAHVMIRHLAIECGYSSAALRERLYVKEADDEGVAMHGVLIFTGTPDSEGSLGGLVRLADAKYIGGLVVRAIQSAAWCGSDPVCLETDPDIAGERLSGAACHCCLLAPETACEKFNRELDRSTLVGSAHGTESPWKGFFDELFTHQD